MLFKWGSGTGTNLSSLREENAILSGGGRASGPLSFMKGFDAFAGVIKSGGKTRRAAKMVILNVDHPDIEKFIWAKAKEEKKAHVLVDAGYDTSLDGEAYGSIFFQNANNSVRATDEFMQAVLEDGDWWTRAVMSGQPIKQLKARELLREIADATWQCGDPGMQFDTTVNRWNPCKNTARINASNPCSEYMFVDDSACNLASLNLMKFVGPDGQFDVEAFRHAVDTVILAQEILVDSASYPTEKIARNSHEYRPAGAGFCQPRRGADVAGHSLRQRTRARLRRRHHRRHVRPGLSDQRPHRRGGRHVRRLRPQRRPLPGSDPHARRGRQPHPQGERARRRSTTPPGTAWRAAYESGRRAGFRNAQVTVIAPTGTIGFMMDCDTTGIEPDLALVKLKKLVGGGVIKIVNNTVPQSLIRLGYSPEQVEQIVSHIDATGTIEDAPHLKAEHLPVFDCSFRPQNGTRFIQHMGHVRMMAAVQPFISGAISKTINMPEDSTVEDIMNAYIESWRLGLKAVAIYRDNSKRVQPLSSGAGTEGKKPAAVQVEEKIVYRPAAPQAARRAPGHHAQVLHRRP